MPTGRFILKLFSVLCRGRALDRLLGPEGSSEFRHYDGAFGGKSPTHCPEEWGYSKQLIDTFLLVRVILRKLGKLSFDLLRAVLCIYGGYVLLLS